MERYNGKHIGNSELYFEKPATNTWNETWVQVEITKEQNVKKYLF